MLCAWGHSRGMLGKQLSERSLYMTQIRGRYSGAQTICSVLGRKGDTNIKSTTSEAGHSKLRATSKNMSKHSCSQPIHQAKVISNPTRALCRRSGGVLKIFFLPATM